MKHITSVRSGFRFLFGAAFLSLALAAAPAAATDYALLVGVGSYDTNYLADVQLYGPSADIRNMRTMLLASEMNTWTEETVMTLSDAQATKGDPTILPLDADGNIDGSIEGLGIRSWIAFFASNLQSGDTFLYYHSGNGGNYTPAGSYGKAVYLSAYDADYSDAELAADLAAFAPGVRILVITDANFAGGLPPLQSSPKPSFPAAVTAYMDTTAPDHAQVGWITSTSYDTESAEGTTGSAFTQAFLAGAQVDTGDVAPYGNEDDLVDAAEAFRYAAARVRTSPQMANAAVVAQFVFAGTSRGLFRAELRGTPTPSSISPETYTCYLILTNGVQSAEYQEYLDLLALYENGEIDEEPEEPDFFDLAEIELPASAVDQWGIDPASAGTFDGGLLTLADAAPETDITLSAAGQYEGVPWTAELVVTAGDPTLSFAEALDNAVIVWDPESWTASNGAGWFGETGISSDYEDALQSLPVPDAGDTRSFSGTFNGRGVLSFRYRVSNGGGSDALVVTLDGQEVFRSGNTVSAWEQTSFLAGPGDHTVVFTYVRTAVAAEAAEGRAWVDRVEFLPVTYAFDMDANDNGWTTGGYSNVWERGTPVFGPPSSGTCWGTDLDGRYPDNADCWLMSPALFVDGDAILTFRTWFDIDNESWSLYAENGSEYNDGWKTYLDGGFVEISINGGGWINITSDLVCPANTSVKTVAGTSGDWVTASVQLPPEAAGKSVRIRFRFAADAYKQPLGSPAGWFIDDVALCSASTSDLVLVRTAVEDTASGNNNGLVEPGESVWVSFELANQGDEDLAGLAGTVQCNVPGIALPAAAATVNYGDLASGAHATGAPRLLVTVADSVAPGTLVRLVQTVTDADGNRYDFESAFPVVNAVALEGTVYEVRATGNGTENVPLAGASVTLSTGAMTTSGASGAYSFPALAAGAYTVSAAADGFAAPAPKFVTIPGADGDFYLGKAYAALSQDDFSFSLADTDDDRTDSFTLSNLSRAADTPGTVPAIFTLSFPEGRPAWLDLQDLGGTILPGGSYPVSFTIDAAAIVYDPVLETVIRISSNDCEGGFETQDVAIHLTLEGLSNALDYLSIDSFEGANFPYHTGDADGYLERGESGSLSFTVSNGSLTDLENLVVTSLTVLDASEGADASDITVLSDLPEIRPTLRNLPADGTATVVPAIEIAIADAGVPDPVYTLEVTLSNPLDGTEITLSGDYPVYDRHTAVGTVYAVDGLGLVAAEPEEPEEPVQPAVTTNVVLTRITYESDDGFTFADPDDPEDVSNQPDEIHTELVGEYDGETEEYSIPLADYDEDAYPQRTCLEDPNAHFWTYILVEFTRFEEAEEPGPQPDPAVRVPVAEAIVYGVGPEGLVETVTLEDGTYVLHGLRNGYNKVYATRSTASVLTGMSKPVLVTDLAEDLPNDAYYAALEADPVGILGIDPYPFAIAEGIATSDIRAVCPGVDLYIGEAENAILEVNGVTVRDENGNGVLEPGENFALSLSVANNGIGICHGFAVRIVNNADIDGGTRSLFETDPLEGDTLAQLQDEEGNPLEDEEGNPVYNDLQLRPGAVAGYADPLYAEALNFEAVAGDPGTMTLLVEITDYRQDVVTGEWTPQSVWYSTLDLDVFDSVLVAGQVTLDGASLPATLPDGSDFPSVRIFLEEIDPDDPDTVFSTTVGATDETGAFAIAILDNLDGTYRLRPDVVTGAIAPDPIVFAATEIPADIVLDYQSIAGISVTPNPLEISHAEGESTTASLVFENGSTSDVTVDSVVVRYVRTSADMARATARRALAPAAADPADTGDAAFDPERDAPGELYVTFVRGVSVADQDALLASLGLAPSPRHRLIPAVHCRFDAATASYEALRAALLASGSVAKVETVRILRATATALSDHLPVADDQADEQWAVCNERQTGGTLGADIDVLPLWEAGITGSRKVIVAVHDSGVAWDHPDLIPNLYVNEAELNGQPDVDDDGNGYVDDIHGWNFADDTFDSSDENGHGTHVAGIIGATANGSGTVGVNWDVTILPIRVADAEGAITVTDENLIRSFEYMLDCGVSVCNCSWGSSYLGQSPRALQGFKAAADAGILFVVAAGNDAVNNDIHIGTIGGVQADNLIVVAAADHDDKIASFSNWGANTVHIAAPGVDILSTVPGGYESMSGTSMATPYVAGAAALLLSAAPDTPTSLIRAAILSGARHDDNLVGWVSTAGHLDVAGAFAALGSDWLVCTTEAPVSIASGASASFDFDVNPDLSLTAGEHEAVIEFRYTIEGQSQTIAVPVTDFVGAGANVSVDSIVVDDSASGDGDGFAEPGETVSLLVTLRNGSSAKLTGAVGTIGSSSDTFPDLVPSATGANASGIVVSIPASASGAIVLDMDLEGTLGTDAFSSTIPVELTVRASASVAGTVRDSSGRGIAGAVVEFWTSGTPDDPAAGYTVAGRVEADASGAYRVDGLAVGATAYLRAIPAGYARSEWITRVDNLSAGTATADFTCGKGSIAYTGLANGVLEKTVRLNDDSATASFSVVNTGASSLFFKAVLVERRSVLLLSDGEALNPVAPALRALGFDVDVLDHNYESVNVNYGSYEFQNEEHVRYSSDEALYLRYDFVVLSLDGDSGGGRQLNLNESTAIARYLARGGRVLVTGGNLLSRPDDTLLSSLLGDASMDRLDATAATAYPVAVDPVSLPSWMLPGITDASFTGIAGINGISNGEPVALPGGPFAYDAATPEQPFQSYAAVAGGDAQKLYRFDTRGGTLFYWGGNPGASEMVTRGIWQDFLRDILVSELFETVPWASVASSAFSVANSRSTTSTVAFDASGLDAGDYEATLVLFGPLNDAETSAIHVTLHVTRPLFQAFSNTGVTNAFGAFLQGDGNPGSFVYQLILTDDPSGAVSAPDATGIPSGGETVVASASTGLYYGYFGSDGLTTDLGQFSELYEIPNDGSAVYAVVRAWTGSAPGAGAFWGDSEPYAVQFTEGESHNFGTWAVANLFQVDGALPLDSNGDGVPDSYVIEHFPGMDPAADLTIEAEAEFLQEIKNGSTSYFPYRVFATDRYVYALDNNQKRVTVWTTAGRTGTFVGYFKPTGAIYFTNPTGMGLQPGANRFAVADAGRHVVHVFEFNENAIAAATSQNLASAFTYTGISVGTIDTPYGQVNSSGVAGLFTEAKGVAMDAEGAIYVVDSGRLNGESGRRVLVFNADGSLRSEILPLETSLVSPDGIDVDSASGDIYVANTGAGNIVRLSAGGAVLGVYSGVTMETVEERPKLETRLDPLSGRSYIVTNGTISVTNTVVGPVGPADVKVWRAGSTFRLVVADREGNAIHVLDSNGDFVATFTNPVGSADTYNRIGNFRKPWGVFPIADSDEVWVADTRNNRLQHLKLTLDGDGDGIDDTLEMLNGLDPTVPDESDTDGDGITDAMELSLSYLDNRPGSATLGENTHTDIDNADSDGDGLTDFEEVNGGTNPLDPEDAAETDCTVTVSAQLPEGGTATGGGTYPAGSTATLVATAADGWQFAGWQDGETAATRDVKVGLYGNDYVALFERQPIVVTVTFVDTNLVAAAGVPAARTYDAYYGIAFHQDCNDAFTADYAFVSGSDDASDKVYVEPVVDFATVTMPIEVTFVGIVGGVPPEPPSGLPTITATAIAVKDAKLSAEFSTDATAVAQLWTFIDEATGAATLIVADTIDHLAAYRASGATDGISTIAVTAVVNEATLGFTIADVDVSGYDTLFIVGFEAP